MQINFICLKYGTELYQQMVDLRFLVLRQPLGLVYTVEDLQKDENYQLFGLIDTNTNQLMACCCLEDIYPVFRLRQMAVHPNFQNQNLGSELIMKVEEWVITNLGNKIEMHARAYAIPFYHKNGYSVEGNEFLEVGIPHRYMYKLI